MKYIVNVPPTNEQGSYKCTADNRQDALWQYNSAREHDGLPPIKKMPRGTQYEPIREGYQDQFVFNYILENIDPEAYEVTCNSDKEKLQFVVDTFKKEFLEWNLKRYGSYQKTFAEWLMGLPSVIHIDFENYEILKIAKKWKSIPEDATEKQKDKILDNWFNFIAAKFFILCNKHKIYISA